MLKLTTTTRQGRSARILLCGLMLCQPLPAGWVWQRDQASATGAGSQWVAVFTYHNTGSQPVLVGELMFACSCTKHSFTATRAAAGGDGELRILLPADTPPGPLELVASGPPDTTPTPLTIQVPRPVGAKLN